MEMRELTPQDCQHRALAERYGLDRDSFNPYLKSGSRRIVEARLRRDFEFTPRKPEVQRHKSYLLGFWNCETPAYVKGKVARKKNSIGTVHVQNSLSWAERYILPTL